MTKVAASDAVADTPSTPGSASGLRSSPCNAAPEAPSAAPVPKAASARGRRISHTTIRSPGVPAPSSAPSTRPTPSGVVPSRQAAAAAARPTAASNPIRIPSRDRALPAIGLAQLPRWKRPPATTARGRPGYPSALSYAMSAALSIRRNSVRPSRTRTCPPRVRSV